MNLWKGIESPRRYGGSEVMTPFGSPSRGSPGHANQGENALSNFVQVLQILFRYLNPSGGCQVL